MNSVEFFIKILIVIIGILFGVSGTKKVIINQDMEVILCDSEEDLEEDSEDSEDDFSNVNEEDLEEDVQTSINN